MTPGEKDAATLDALVYELITRLNDLGIYIITSSLDFHAAGPEVVDALQSGDLGLADGLATGAAVVNVQLVGAIGDIALTDKVLHPERVAAEQEFLAIAPLESTYTEDEILRELLADDDDDREG